MNYVDLSIISSRYERILRDALGSGYNEAKMRWDLEYLIRDQEAKGHDHKETIKSLATVKKRLKTALEWLSKKAAFKKAEPIFLQLINRLDKAKEAHDINMILLLAIDLVVPPQPDPFDGLADDSD